jgi:integrase
MAVRIIKKSWWVDLRVEHKRYRKRSPENSRAGALAYETTIRQRLARGEDMMASQHAARSISFAEFQRRWFEEYVAPNNKPSEQRTKKYVLSGSLVPFFGRKDIGEISGQDIERYKAALIRAGISRKTVNNRLTILRKCLHTAYDWLELKGTPPKIEWLKCAPPRTDFLTPDECELLLQNSDGVIGELILTALRTGMRQGELKGLQWTSIDWLNRSVAVRHSYSEITKSLGSPKGNRERHVPLDIDLFEAFAARKRDSGFVFTDALGQPFNHKKLSKALTEVCGRAGTRKIKWHALRHTFATQLAMNGTPLNIVQTLLGHSTIMTTMRYAHVAPSALRAAIDFANPRTASADNFGQPAGNRWQERQLLQRLARTVGAGDTASKPSNRPDGLPLAA